MTKEDKLGTEKMSKLMASMAIPSIIAQIINILYNIVDRIYIGHIPGVGAAALTGVGIVFPIVTLLSAFSAFASSAGAPLASIRLGMGDRKGAERILGCSVAFLILSSVILMGIFYLGCRPFLYMFGASDATIPYGESYLKIYLVGTLFVELALGLNAFIIIQGHSQIAMCSILIGAILNLILDPIFIFLFGWGVKGAAIATVISQFVSGAWNVGFLIGKKATLKIRKEEIRLEKKLVWSIASLGVSPFIMRSTESLISIVMNRQLQIYGGDLYVGSLTIMQSVMQLMSAPTAGFTQGVQSIVSYNFGAGKFDRVRTAYRCMIGGCLGFGFVISLLVMVFPGFFGRLFTTDEELLNLVCRIMPVFFTGMLIFGVQQGIQPTFLALNQAKASLFIACLRKVILLVPLALILPRFFGVMGVYYAEPVSDVISAITASALFFRSIGKILTPEYLRRMKK